MAISVTDLGGNVQAAGISQTISLSVPAGGVPAGSLIYIGTGVKTASATPTSTWVSDGGFNTYTMLSAVGNASNGFGTSYYAANCAAITTGSAPSFTFTSTGTAAKNIVAFYATGISTTPVDTGVTATASGTSTQVSVTSGSASQTGQLFVGLMYSNVGAPTFTQATGWTSPPDQELESGSNLAGGNQVNSGSGALTYNPVLSLAEPWWVQVVGFKPLGGGGGTASFPLRMLLGIGR